MVMFIWVKILNLQINLEAVTKEVLAINGLIEAAVTLVGLQTVGSRIIAEPKLVRKWPQMTYHCLVVWNNVW